MDSAVTRKYSSHTNSNDIWGYFLKEGLQISPPWKISGPFLLPLKKAGLGEFS